MYEYSLYVLPVSSLSLLFQVQHTWYLVPVHANAQQAAESEVRGSVSCVKNSLWAGTTSLRRVTSRATPSSGGEWRSAVSPWNVDPLRSTILLRGIRSIPSGVGQRSFCSSALNRKSCHASVSVMLEKQRG